jgi:uncharacterized membrane protein YkvA (DUF1232 family)
MMRTVVIIAMIILALYMVFIIGLMLAGKRTAARAIAGLIPDCIVLFRNLLRDKRVPKRYKVILGVLVAYLAFPIDIVPDFIPIAGVLDDAILVAMIIRYVIKGVGMNVVTENWQGPKSTLRAIFKVARVK